MKKWILLILMFCSISLSESSAETTGPYRFTRDYQTSAGTVSFSHDKHAGTYTTDCYFCHSALKIFGGTVDKFFAHNFCNDCHVKKASTTSTKCDFCHTKQVELSVR